MPLNNFDAREVTMHYKRKGDRVDEVLHDIVLNHVNRLEAENKRLQDELAKVIEFADYKLKLANDLTKQLSEEMEENKRLREALEFYANEKTYKQISSEEPPDIWSDEGHIAREALEGDKND